MIFFLRNSATKPRLIKNIVNTFDGIVVDTLHDKTFEQVLADIAVCERQFGGIMNSYYMMRVRVAELKEQCDALQEENFLLREQLSARPKLDSLRRVNLR